MAWREEEHPRDGDGKFTDGNGSKPGNVKAALDRAGMNGPTGRFGSITPGEGEITDAFIDSSSENSKSNAEKIFEFTEQFETVFLPKREYRYIMSQIATNMPQNQKNQPIVKMAIANHWYIFENRGFGEYRIIDIISID